MLDNLIGTITDASLDRYRESWQRFMSFCQDQGIEPLNASSVLAWRTNLVESLYSPNTINSHLSAIKSIMGASVPSGEVSLELYTQVRAVGTVSVRALRDRLRPDKDLLTTETMQLLVDSISGKDALSLRDKALIALLSTSGARISEVVSLRVDNMNMAESTFSVLGKTDIVRRLAPTNRVAMSHVMTWLYERGFMADYVFTSYQGKSMTPVDKPMSRQAAHAVIVERAKAAGLNIACHDFRRFVATQLAQENIKQAQEALGHASITTTQRYVKRTELPSVDWLK